MTELLRDSKDKQVSFRWPMALDQRLDALVDRAEAAGERTTRREVLAALIANADLAGAELGELIRGLRRARVGDVVLDADPKDNVVTLLNYRPGPR
ncbi:hypothetical protein [Leifsonia sp. NPDC058230]|uniref:hypothetical protein n=1 Tax=Leifsonia sp. NPDC058230 TaxID=3346391 RepID=UPI0036D7FFFA